MTNSHKKKLIALNASVWGVGILASFILPMISDSITDGSAAFLRMFLHVFPLFVGMYLSTILMAKSFSALTP